MIETVSVTILRLYSMFQKITFIILLLPHFLKHSSCLKFGKFHVTIHIPSQLGNSRVSLWATKDVNTFHEIDQDAYDVLERSIRRLRQERDKRKQDLLAADLAVRQAERDMVMLTNPVNIDDNYDSELDAGYDYGFISKSMGPLVSTRTAEGKDMPASAVKLAIVNFKTEFGNIVKSVWPDETIKNETEVSKQLAKLKLSNEAVWKREYSRAEVSAPLVIKLPYLFLCLLLDALFNNSPIERFYFLETVARMPYFSYITMLHVYETLGWWRRSTESKRIHFAEEINEYHHLLIMISLGGDQNWRVRFLAQHAAIVYYFVLIGLWCLSPTLAYNFSELIEAHAVDTYGEFVDSNEDILRSLRAPIIAKQYYEASDMYMFDEFQTNRVPGERRPVVNTLYDVFCNIRDDEREHVNTMSACQDPDVRTRSPNTEAAIIAAGVATALVAVLTSELGLDADSSALNFDNILENVAATAGALGSGALSFLKSGQSLDLSTATNGFEIDATTLDSSAGAIEDLSTGSTSVTKLVEEVTSILSKYLRF